MPFLIGGDNGLANAEMLLLGTAGSAMPTKLLASVPEYLGGDIVMQFELPDLADIVSACGLTQFVPKTPVKGRRR